MSETRPCRACRPQWKLFCREARAIHAEWAQAKLLRGRREAAAEFEAHTGMAPDGAAIGEKTETK